MKYEESDKVELKREMIEDIDKEIIAFLNAHGGIIYIGVDNSGNVVGVADELRDQYDEMISAILTNNIKPNCRNLVDFYFNQNNVLEIRIKEGESKPYYLTTKGPKPSGTYIRVGRSKRPAIDNEILTMIRDSSGRLRENQKSNIQNLSFNEFSKIAIKKKLDFGPHKFRNLKIIDKDEKFTNLGLLISDQNPFEIKFAVYDWDLNFKVKEEFKGSIALIAEDLLKYAELFNTTFARIIPGQISRVESKSYPGASLREAILNAICHAEYFAPSNIKVEFFPNKVKVTSPGNIYNEGTIADIKKGIQSFRNPGLIVILNKLGYIENYGTGIQRIMNAYKDSKNSPEFYVSNSYFIITLYNLNPIEPHEVRNHAQKTTIHDYIVKLINKNPKITKKQISKEIGVSKATIERELSKSNDIKYVGSAKSGHWEVIYDSNPIGPHEAQNDAQNEAQNEAQNDVGKTRKESTKIN